MAQVRNPMDAEEVTLGWDDLGMMQTVEGEAVDQPLVPWSADTPVPAPPRPMPMLSVFQVRRRQPRLPSRSRTAPGGEDWTHMHASGGGGAAPAVAIGVPVATASATRAADGGSPTRYGSDGVELASNAA